MRLLFVFSGCSLLLPGALFRTFPAPFLTGNTTSIYFAVFFPFFLLAFLAAGIPTPSAVYPRSANAHNGCTKVTEFASVQRTTRARVGLRGRELQTIAGLRDNRYRFSLGGKRASEREKRAIMLHCCELCTSSEVKELLLF